MTETSKIEWTDATFNPWIGCTKVSPACDHCYAEAWAKRFGTVEWGAKAPRKRTSPATWNLPRKWQRQAPDWFAEYGRPRFVFCASLADVFDNAVPEDWRADLWDLIRECDQLQWLLLTKRPQNIAKTLPPDWGDGWQQAWLGTTVEDQKRADQNVPALLNIPAAQRFLSCEPLLGSINLARVSLGVSDATFAPGVVPDGVNNVEFTLNTLKGAPKTGIPAIDWVIVGGESGKNARPMHPEWARLIRYQCDHADVPFHFKQWGEWVHVDDLVETNKGDDVAIIIRLDGTEWSYEPGFPQTWQQDGGAWMHPAGTALSGRLLDGTTHDERPTATCKLPEIAND